MHEEAMVRDLVRKVEEVARSEGGIRVTRVRLWVGALSHLTARGLRDRWPVATRQTAAEGSDLDLTVSSDPRDPRSTDIVLESVDVAPSGEVA
ncbi:MAG TPA: hydrogenase maturation nickel metallochaperone HypA [Thermoplasmata archaeon]|nr:hydrogenase maturation nickel metallochaperone HypA [Thermoplasmata archaeon]